MSKSMRRLVASLLLLAATLAGIAAIEYFRSLPRTANKASASESIERFLARYWNEPIPPQGQPPAGFSTLEASLAPSACGECHKKQYEAWRLSLHSKTISAGVLWQFHLIDQYEANSCMHCHAPLAEQKALMALEMGWPSAPASSPPDYVPRDLHRQGLVCAACHVRRHVRFGPRQQRRSNKGVTRQIHNGFQPTPAFKDSRFCAGCHQFPPGGRELNGKLLENTYEEWRSSQYGKTGQSCQSCHMHEGNHFWGGIHDKEMVQRALTADLVICPVNHDLLQVQATIRNTGAGHHFPTYVVAEVIVSLWLVNLQDKSREELARAVIARRTDVDLTKELFDSRIAVGESLALTPVVARQESLNWSVELLVDVIPRSFYERMFRRALEQRDRLQETTARLLEQSLMEAQAARYSALRIVRPLAAKPDPACDMSQAS